MAHPATLIDIASTLIGRAAALTGSKRLILGMAGAPASGKSTSADELCGILNRLSPSLCAVLPMDGFHYDDAVLTEMGRLPRKGAPDTFDVGGFAATLQRLRANTEPFVAVPVFDRTLEISRGSARLIASDVKIVIAEGNYLLVDQEPWNSLSPLLDVTVQVSSPRETLRRRLYARWQSFHLPEAEIRRKVEDNDLPNADFVLRHSRPADHVLETA